MASRQEKEQRKETAAASDLSDVNRDKGQESHEERPGVIVSVIKAVQSAKEAVVGKTNDKHGTRDEDVGYCAGDRSRSRETTMTAKETTESDARTLDEKVREAAERTKQMAESAKGKTKDIEQSATEKTKEKAQEAKEKTLETSQSAADKMKDTVQSAAGKLGELKDKAMGLLSGKKEEAKERTYEATGTAKEKPREVQEEVRQREEEMGLTDRDKYEGDLAGRVPEDKDEGKKDRLGALGVLKEKLTPHTPNGTSRVAGKNEDEKKAQGTSEEKGAEVYMEDTSPGTIASALKVSDQMTGQTFNDVGWINDEGVVCIMRRDLQGKM